MAVLALLLVLGLSPLMRGGNRNVAMIVLEAGALAFLVAVLARSTLGGMRFSLRGALLFFLLSSPVWLALVYLLPLPSSLWQSLAGREGYPAALAAAGISVGEWLPLSLVPDATLTSLFAGIPLVAAFVAGYWMRPSGVKVALTALVVVAFFEVALGLLQAGTGRNASLFFGTSDRPMGSFANPNHFANYLAMALAGYVWLGWSSLTQRRPHLAQGSFRGRHPMALWAAGAVLLVIGILMSRSRGATLSGLFTAVCAVTLAVSTSSRQQTRRRTILLVSLGLLAALSLVGFDLALSRFDTDDLRDSARMRNMLASSSMTGATQFWPWGSGWGTFETVYPRFQPPSVVGLAGYAHQDYAHMLFEGGIFSVLLMASFAALAAERAVRLVRSARRRGRLRREEMASALCGLGLLGFLLHSVVEFNMHIPANAIAAALLAGIYLRPLQGREESADD